MPPPAYAPWLAMVEQLRAAWLAEQPVEVVQTHISAVLIGARHVLKLKKPVNFGFLDYSTLAKRHAACMAEVTLNRRLAPETYLGVETIYLRDGAFHLDAPGEVADYAVLMKRLPAARMLDEMVMHGEVTDRVIDAVAQRLAEFHRASPRTPEVERWGEWEHIAGQWRENFEQTRPFVGRSVDASTVAQVDRWVERQLSARGRFDARVRERRIVDGHGDLRCESVCLTDPIQFFDCIEFSDRLRCCDAASEVAFLAMDLTSRGRPDLAYHFTERYIALSGDTLSAAGGRGLLPFYCCYRAWVRGKVLSFRLDEAEFTAEQKAQDATRARAFFELAQEYTTELAAPTAIMVMGISGTGKTSVARAVAHLLGVRCISTDVVRNELFGSAKQPAAFGEGAYDAGHSQRTYEELFRQAAAECAAGRSVVIDGTFLNASHRALAEGLGVAARWIQCELHAEVACGRIARRRRLQDGASDADAMIHLRQRELLAREALPEGRLVLDTSQPLLDAAREALEWLRAFSE